MDLQSGIIILIVFVCLLAIWLVFYFIPVGLWFSALVSGVRISLLQLILMRWRKVPPSTIVSSMIEGTKAGLHLDPNELEAHYLAGGNVTFNTLPVTSIDGQGDYGESIVTVDVAEVHRFFDNLAKTAKETSESAAPSATDTGEKPVADNLEIHVLNAGDISGLAGGVGSWLEEVGYTVARTANADPGIYSESQVVAADPESETAKKFAEQLGGLPVTANANLDENTLIVVTGNDYNGPSDQAQTDAFAAEDSTAEAPVGTPGADFGTAEVSPEISAGGDSPRCVN